MARKKTHELIISVHVTDLQPFCSTFLRNLWLDYLVNKKFFLKGRVRGLLFVIAVRGKGGKKNSSNQ